MADRPPGPDSHAQPLGTTLTRELSVRKQPGPTTAPPPSAGRSTQPGADGGSAVIRWPPPHTKHKSRSASGARWPSDRTWPSGPPSRMYMSQNGLSKPTSPLPSPDTVSWAAPRTRQPVSLPPNTPSSASQTSRRQCPAPPGPTRPPWGPPRPASSPGPPPAAWPSRQKCGAPPLKIWPGTTTSNKRH